MEDDFNFNDQYIKIRKIANKLYLEVWDLYTNSIRSQVPLSHYKYNIDGEEFNITKR